VRSSRALLALAVLASSVASLAACAKPISFIVLDLQSSDPNRDILEVKEVVVTVTQGTSLHKTLTYPAKPSGGVLTITQDANVNTLSVSFSAGHTGSVDVSVTVKDASGCTVGFVGGVSVSIREGGSVAAPPVLLVPQKDCTVPDGGVDAGGDTFPGCDPAAPGLMCPATDTCQVNCMTQKGECTAGGKGGPGAACTTNKDCAPGEQCFDYSSSGCTGVRVCLRFCHDDVTCQGSATGSTTDAGTTDAGTTDAGDGGAEAGAASASGTASLCQGLVPCQSGLTGYHTCTFGCDPRQVAIAAGKSGCPTGLACMVVASMDQVDCACPEATRKGVDGDDCAGGAQCAPGYICNMMSDAKKCRAVCRCDAKGMTCQAPNDCTNGKVCSALTNDTTFGVCL